MKCEHCGKNEVAFIYRRNFNGQVTEQHLCGKCAEQLGVTQHIAAQNRRMMEGFFGDDLFGGFFSTPSLFDRMWGENLLDDFFTDLPALSAAPAKEQEPPKQQDLLDEATQSHFSALRQRNALKLELKQAIRQENFERAAELRDELRTLEHKQNHQSESA